MIANVSTPTRIPTPTPTPAQAPTPAAAERAAPRRDALRAMGVFRTLGWWEGEALLAHLRRLSPIDLNMRFHGAMSAEALARHAAEPLTADRNVIGWFKDGVLRGAAELILCGDVAEAAFSVEAPFRRMGLGEALMARALRRARNRGARELVVHTTRSNRAMMRLAAAFDARMEAEMNEVEARIPVPAADAASVALDAADEEMGALGAFWAAQGRAALRLWRAPLALAANAAEPGKAAREAA
ncbi:GNAT family N-acetyltransferase [Oceanicella actignis]|uniref:Acetyltransferase (GNAT) family protein n=1 Tax=Oceanicella actignis TaxID=1189325 RepID=A0A1M7SE33_9RHOB|nr:GNAT family N-acetyltransferase [Oceanicella actignis]TYO91356.1 acetyltransferase (GNAT) family protein [Oceanicella actignis]SET23960.1 Acetyltransferase (GNAT) family protein [Oceanicella actignis]SHN56713.1 Acetyltransferase (GNAT) family protein [Oceanicella actignis]